MDDVRIWPVRGYAPGSYMCQCRICGGQFMGDKRAYECAPCVLEAERRAALLREAVKALKGGE